jgi:hypothetical protein
LEEHVASLFRPEEYAKQETGMKQCMPEDGGDVLLKCRLTFNGLHGVILRKYNSSIEDGVNTE